eukprot:2689463-Alexandrium_andersonii.AAC.1
MCIRDRREPEGEEAAEPLGQASVGSYRALAARANFLSLDRPDLVFAAKERCRGMSCLLYTSPSPGD